MATADNILKAKALTALGVWVFPVYVYPDPENPYKTTKKPGTEKGFYDATNDPFYVEDLFERHPKAEVGVWMGPSKLNAADFDVKRSPDGTILVDGFDEFDKHWLDLPTTHSFDSISGAGGKQYIYSIEEVIETGGNSNYRGIKGVDRRWGNSYSVWNGPVPTSREAFTPAPEWLMDRATIRDAAQFEGDVAKWYESLEQGEPSLIVRSAMERARKQFEENGNDFSHSDIVERQFEAVRLGAEGHPGVPALLDLIEELVHARTGSHSRDESEWDYEFQEALASGVEKYGAAISLRASLPEYSMSLVPAQVSETLFTGTPGSKADFSALLRALQAATDDDLVVTSVLWNSPKTRDLSREWGLEFVHQRVTEARTKPEPVRENPTLPAIPEPELDKPEEGAPEPGIFLTDPEAEKVAGFVTFPQRYHEASLSKGFTNPSYVPPVAWTALSMAFGYRGFIPLAKSLECNLWFITLGESTTGKGTEDTFLRSILNTMFLDGESENYNLGAQSSPDGLHLGLINRDRLPSIIHNDEAADFFQDIKAKDWMAPVPDKLAKWYDGFVEPSSKISLKDARGKAVHTSLNQLMWGTPDRILTLLDASQFSSGYLARVNWVWDGTIPDPNRKSSLKIQEHRSHETPNEAFDIAADLLHARNALPERFSVGGSNAAQKRLNKAADDFRKHARKSPRWDFVKPAVDRLVMETLWKLAALTAMYRGDQDFTEDDALVAISFASDWLLTLMKVSETISESPYSRDIEEMETFIRKAGGMVTRATLLHQFRGKVVRSARELDDRISFLVDSGRILRKQEGSGDVRYELNGS